MNAAVTNYIVSWLLRPNEKKLSRYDTKYWYWLLVLAAILFYSVLVLQYFCILVLILVIAIQFIGIANNLGK